MKNRSGQFELANKAVAEALRQAVSDYRLNRDGQAFGVSVSIGLVSVQASSSSVQDLMAEADAACYAAKALGRNRIHVHGKP